MEMQVPAVSARFGTAPEIWNIAMWLTARLSPPSMPSLHSICIYACVCVCTSVRDHRYLG